MMVTPEDRADGVAIHISTRDGMRNILSPDTVKLYSI